jgi:hypothetical protein
VRESQVGAHVITRVVVGAGALAVVLLVTTTTIVGAISSPQRVAPAPATPLGTACSHALVHDADGNVTPLRCSSTQFNVQAWHWYAKVRPAPILALGRNTTLANVERALCRAQSATLPMRISEYTLASTYNDWRFSRSIVLARVSKGCS